MYKVLIAEDDPMVAMINEQYVKKNAAYTVVGKVRDGQSALAFLAEHPVDLVILDIYMPVMDGLETLKAIRAQQIAVEAIMVTAANDRASLEEALHFGVVDYLVKPFAFDRFQLALDKFAAQKAAFGDAEQFDQENIDSIVEGAAKKPTAEHPKGIQEKTLQTLLACLREMPGAYFPGDVIAEKTRLTGVTVRRYMAYLEEIGQVESRLNYETGGRPCTLYRVKHKE